MIQIIVLVILCVTVLVSVGFLAANGISVLIKKSKSREYNKPLRRVKKAWKVAAVTFAAVVAFVLISQLGASTPPIDAGVNNSIAELRQVEVNGRKEWISLRGKDKTAPLLLFLAGGPGGTQMTAVRHELAALEEHFVVVGWDQPGSGKSFFSVPTDQLTTQIYIDDGIALTEYLLQEFGQEKLFLVGESWGSALGILMASEKPEQYHAFIGTGQMVDFLETEIIDYNLALELAGENSDTALVTELMQNGAPPYYGNDVTWKSAKYLNYLSGIMSRNPEISNSGFQTSRDIGSSEYGVIDKINFLLGLAISFNQVYPQLYEIDLRTDYSKLDVPVYFFIGKHDINAPLSLMQEYFEILDAPKKELIWFEHSGHSPWINEPEKFVAELVDIANAD